MQIESIADHLDWAPVIAGWRRQEWGDTDPLGSLAHWTHGLAARTARDQIPAAYAAVERGRPLGSVTLVEHDMEIRWELSPWQAGLYGQPQSRQQGVGGALVRHALWQVRRLGFPALYLYPHPVYPPCSPVLRAPRLGSPRGHGVPRAPGDDNVVLSGVSCAPSLATSA
jgi:GNAT superfamily N-acetyltransferase